MMRNKAVAVIASAAFLAMTGCASKATEETTNVAITQVETAVAVEESTAAVSGEDSTKGYTLTNDGKGELENVFMDCFYFHIGDHQKQLFADLSTENVEELLCSTFITPDSYLAKGVYEDGIGYTISKDEAAEYLKGGFGVDMNSYDFSADPYTTLEDNGDTFSWAGGDYGNGIPDAIINKVVHDPDSGIITLTGDALFIDVDAGEINPYIFTATMKPSESKYFDGNTLVSFEYEENTTGVYLEINPEKYGLYADHHFEIKEWDNREDT